MSMARAIEAQLQMAGCATVDVRFVGLEELPCC